MTRWDWTVEKPVYIDFESQSLDDLRHGGRRYAEHPSTRASMCSFYADDELLVWVGPAVPFELAPGGEAGGVPYTVVREPPSFPGRVLCAHNAAGFDRHVWARVFGGDPTWFDTVPLCRAAGLAGGLDAVGHALFGTGKDPAGALTKLLCRARVVGGQVAYPVATVAAWDQYVRYCATDAVLLSRVHAAVPPTSEPEVLTTHFAINDRGLPVDRAWAACLVLAQDELAGRSGAAMAEASGGEFTLGTARSTKASKEWFQRKGLRLPEVGGKASLDRRELAKVFDEPEAYYEDDATPDDLAVALEVMRLRQDVVRAGAGKALAFLEYTDDDGRARDLRVYHGAHTGRLTGRAVQPHNLAKGVDAKMPEMPTLAAADAEAARLGCQASDVLATWVRPAICAPEGLALLVVDYGQVEARGIAWIARDLEALEAFGDPANDPYMPLARKIFGVDRPTSQQRFVAKQAELGCGYGMSGGKFDATVRFKGAEAGVDLENVTIVGKDVVRAYRAKHPRIVQVWRDLERAAFAAMKGDQAVAGRCVWETEGKALSCKLPSGRRIRYRGARIETRVPGWARVFGVPADKAPCLVYDHPHGYTAELYGGKIAENVVQGVCRDLMVAAEVELERRRSPVVMDVHDEVIVESRADGLAEVVEVVSTSPEWAADFPVLAEGWAGPRYAKKPYEGCVSMRAFRGRVLR